MVIPNVKSSRTGIRDDDSADTKGASHLTTTEKKSSNPQDGSIDKTKKEPDSALVFQWKTLAVNDVEINLGAVTSTCEKAVYGKERAEKLKT